MVNVFWLAESAEEAARAYCDQHVMKIHGEIAESAWDVIKVLAPELYEKATADGIDFRWRKHRHGGGWKNEKYTHMHPLPRWMALCRANFCKVLEMGLEILYEHKRRFGKEHAVWKDLHWLQEHAKEIDFQVLRWSAWFDLERKGLDSRNQPYSDWFDRYGYCTERASGGYKVYVWCRNDRNTCSPTHFAQIMEDDAFPGCRTTEQAVVAARNHYIMKAGAPFKGVISKRKLKQKMRYFYTEPPKWLLEAGAEVQTVRKTKAPKRKISEHFEAFAKKIKV